MASQLGSFYKLEEVGVGSVGPFAISSACSSPEKVSEIWVWLSCGTSETGHEAGLFMCP